MKKIRRGYPFLNTYKLLIDKKILGYLLIFLAGTAGPVFILYFANRLSENILFSYCIISTIILFNGLVLLFGKIKRGIDDADEKSDKLEVAIKVKFTMLIMISLIFFILSDVSWIASVWMRQIFLIVGFVVFVLASEIYIKIK